MASWLLGAPDRLDLDLVTDLRVHLVKGSLNVVRGGPDQSCAIAGLSGRRVRVVHEGGALTVEYERGVARLPLPLAQISHLRRDRAEVTVETAADCPVTVTAVNTTVSITGGAGPVDVRCLSGDITLLNVGGTVRARTGRGLIRVVGGDADLDVDLHAGDFTLARGRGGTVRANSIHGSHTVELDSVATDLVELRCRVGDITVRVPADSDLRVDLTSVHGDVTSEFAAVAGNAAGPDRHAAGVLGDGRGTLRARTDTGRVTILRGAPCRPDGPDGPADPADTL